MSSKKSLQFKVDTSDLEIVVLFTAHQGASSPLKTNTGSNRSGVEFYAAIRSLFGPEAYRGHSKSEHNMISALAFPIGSPAVAIDKPAGISGWKTLCASY